MTEETASVHKPKNWWRDASLVDRLKASADLVGMIRAHGVDLQPQGSDLVGCCPFHAEKTPSFHVTPSKGLWHCFGCGKGGSAVDWIVTVSGCSIREAFEQLRIQQGEVDPAASKPRDWLGSSFAPDPDWDDARLVSEVVDYYARRLESSPLAQDYLRRRGLWDAALVSRYRLGFADRTLGLSIGKSANVRNTRLRERLSGLGLMRASGHEHFTGCVVVPVLSSVEGPVLSPSKGKLDGDGSRQVLGMYGRRVNPCSRPGQVPHLYLKGAHRGVFNAEAVRFSGADTVILCESLLDALTFVRWGWESVTCAYGVRGVTPELWSFLTESGFRRVVIAFDADAAGDEAARDLAPRLHAEGLEVQRLALPAGLDVNELSLRSNDPARALQQALDGASWMSAELYPDRPARLGRRAEVAVDVPETVSIADEEFRCRVTEGVAQPSAAFPLAAEVPVLSERQRVEGSAVAAVSVEESESVAKPDESLPSTRLADGFEGDSGTCEVAFGDRSWRVKGLSRNRTDDSLRVTVRVLRQGAADTSTGHGTGFHLDTLDLYQAKSREAYARTASVELGLSAEVVRADLARLVVRLEDELQALRKAASQPAAPVRAELSAAEREEALALLRRPDMLRQLLCDLDASGMVGEEGNKLLCWLALTSRRLDSPLGLLIQSTSAAGKSSLLDGVLRTMPEEEIVRYSAMSGQALFYMGGVSLKHKILCVAEEEGARRASYSLKLLQSDGELSMASTGKDPDSGQLVTKEYRTEGPVALAMTTTSLDVDPELQNRCLVLAVDESREQTEAIHARQRAGRTREGQAQRQEASGRLSVWRNAQRLLEPLAVVNPFAESLTFASHRTRTRRDMAKYLTLVEAVALAHQHRKPRRFDARGCYIEVDLDDIELANLLAVRGLGMGLSELSGPTERLLRTLRPWVRAQAEKQGVALDQIRFSRRDLSDSTPWSASQLKEHLRVLVEHEALMVVRGKAGVLGAVQYQLCAWEDESLVSAAGLLDASKLAVRHPAAPYRGTWAHGLHAAGGRPEVGRGWAGSENRPTPIVARMDSEVAQDATSRGSENVQTSPDSGSDGSVGETRIGKEWASHRSGLIVPVPEVAAGAPSGGRNGHRRPVAELVG